MKTINKDSRGLWRHYKLKKFCLKSQNKFRGRKYSKRQKKRKKRNKCRAPQVCCHAPPRSAKMCWKELFLHTCGACASEKKQFFCFWLQDWRKSTGFQPKSSWKSTYKYNSSHSQILIKNEAVQEEGKHYEHQGRSLSLTFVSIVCFISFVICLCLPQVTKL